MTRWLNLQPLPLCYAAMSHWTYSHVRLLCEQPIQVVRVSLINVKTKHWYTTSMQTASLPSCSLLPPSQTSNINLRPLECCNLIGSLAATEVISRNTANRNMPAGRLQDSGFSVTGYHISTQAPIFEWFAKNTKPFHLLKHPPEWKKKRE